MFHLGIMKGIIKGEVLWCLCFWFVLTVVERKRVQLLVNWESFHVTNSRHSHFPFIQNMLDTRAHVQNVFRFPALHVGMVFLCVSVTTADWHILHGDLRAKAGDGSASQRAGDRDLAGVSPSFITVILLTGINGNFRWHYMLFFCICAQLYSGIHRSETTLKNVEI